mmetsp:Transcript_15206/g.28427  ORF Transcript_15206/g.28427 Transcript_15206/m.28427 type:complete len:101 (-) Transcript_15206:615-917(-)
MIGGALACPASVANKGWAIFLTTNKHDTAVATARNTQETIPKGMMQMTATGRKGTRLYPYKQIHSASVKAFMDIQQYVVIHKIVGKTKAKPQQMDAACNR